MYLVCVRESSLVSGSICSSYYCGSGCLMFAWNAAVIMACMLDLVWIVGETGYGCHTWYITDVFRNIVIIADIRIMLCLNIVSCAHINM